LTATVDAADGSAVADGTSVDFASSLGDLTPPTETTMAGSAAVGLLDPNPFPLPARIRTRASVGEITDLLDVTLVPSDQDPVSIELTLASDAIPADGTSATSVLANVRKLDGSAVADGTRVLFRSSAGTPSAASVETLNGLAEITLTASDTPGAFEAGARVADSVVEGSALGTFGSPRRDTATFALTNMGGDEFTSKVHAIQVAVSFPDGAAPVQDGSGVIVELIGEAQGGIAFAGIVGSPPDTVNVGIIHLSGITQRGPFLRVSFDLPPGGQLTCASLPPFLDEAADLIGFPVPGVDVECQDVDPAQP
jgi:hypothetical protein